MGLIITFSVLQTLGMPPISYLSHSLKPPLNRWIHYSNFNDGDKMAALLADTVKTSMHSPPSCFQPEITYFATLSNSYCHCVNNHLSTKTARESTSRSLHAASTSFRTTHFAHQANTSQ